MRRLLCFHLINEDDSSISPMSRCEPQKNARPMKTQRHGKWWNGLCASIWQVRRRKGRSNSDSSYFHQPKCSFRRVYWRAATSCMTSWMASVDRHSRKLNSSASHHPWSCWAMALDTSGTCSAECANPAQQATWFTMPTLGRFAWCTASPNFTLWTGISRGFRVSKLSGLFADRRLTPSRTLPRPTAARSSLRSRPDRSVRPSQAAPWRVLPPSPPVRRAHE